MFSGVDETFDGPLRGDPPGAVTVADELVGTLVPGTVAVRSPPSSLPCGPAA
ncbi:hypothetical protein AB0C52_24280 [Streptomyces sp. NPDC048717]|uniref:hypothetical protein n=1 Tax=Streptomyces sp. NPDC048717 TaxID=3154928 RepID=UPI0034193230